MANGMAGLFVGASGLKTAQTALNTTAHNLSNINTTGYTRQQVTFSDTTYVNVNSKDKVSYASYGLGVAISEVRRIRDQYIDLAYRNENSRLGFYESQYNAVQEIEDQFGEMQGVTYESYLTNLYDSINELAKNPTSTVARSSLIQNATAFTENVYKGLRDYQTTLNTQVSNMVNKINNLAGQIYKLNKSIAKVEAPGMEKANDLRDQRDAAIDELSKYIDITYYESENKETIINAAGVPLVTAGELTAMGTRVVEGTTLVIPTWPSYERDVYEDGKLATNADDTDKGQLKGLIIARGNMVVDYTVVPVAPDSNDYDMSTEEGRTAYQQAYNEYAKQQEYYNTYVEPSAILSAMAGFDKLVNGIVERINGILCPEKTETRTNPYLNADGSEIQADTYIYNSVDQPVLYDRYGREVTGTDNGDGTYSISKPDDVILDLGAVAKGYIADKIKDFLEENGVKRAIINLGGNVLCIGKKTNTDNFGIGVRKPFAANNEVLVALSVDDSSVVSSGNYERYFYADDGTFYHHILNPATGYSYDNDLSDVTILSKDSLTGDCLSTTCFCLGLEDGMKLIESLDGIEAVFVTNEGEIHYSSGAKAYVKS